MAKEKEKSYINTTINTKLLKSIKMLAVDKDTRINILLEEAIRDLLKKYESDRKKSFNS